MKGRLKIKNSLEVFFPGTDQIQSCSLSIACLIVYLQIWDSSGWHYYQWVFLCFCYSHTCMPFGNKLPESRGNEGSFVHPCPTPRLFCRSQICKFLDS